MEQLVKPLPGWIIRDDCMRRRIRVRILGVCTVRVARKRNTFVSGLLGAHSIEARPYL